MMSKIILTIFTIILLGITSTAKAEISLSNNTTVDLVFTIALSSDVPLYLRSPEAPYRMAGIRLEISKEWANDYFLEVSPYMWGGYTSIASVGGLIVRSGYFNGDWGVNFLHESVHNFDQESIGGGMGFDAIEFRVRF